MSPRWRWPSRLRPAFSLRSLLLAITLVACVAAIPQKLLPWERRFRKSGQFSDVTISSNGQLVACAGSNESTIQVFDSRSGEQLLAARGDDFSHPNRERQQHPNVVTFGHDDRLVVLHFQTRSASWDVTARPMTRHPISNPYYLKLAPGIELQFQTDFNLVERWEPAYRMQQCPAMARSRFPARLSRNGQVMAFVTRDGIEVWRPAQRWRWVTSFSAMSAALATALACSIIFDQRRRRVAQQPPAAATVAT